MINSCSCCHLQNKSAPQSPINTLYLSCLTLFHFMQVNFTASIMLIQTWFTSIGLLILVSIIHAPFCCHNSSMPYLQRGRGVGEGNWKKKCRKLLNAKVSPFSPFHFPTKPFHHSIVSLLIFSLWLFSMAFGYGIKQVNWWFLQVNTQSH